MPDKPLERVCWFWDRKDSVCLNPDHEDAEASCPPECQDFENANLIELDARYLDYFALARFLRERGVAQRFRTRTEMLDYIRVHCGELASKES